MNLYSYLCSAMNSLLRMQGPQPVQPTDYDTSWAGTIVDKAGTLAFPQALARLVERQKPDGSWGSEVPHKHDRLLSTLAVTLLFAKVGGNEYLRACQKAGEHYILQNASKLSHDASETIGFEMLVPTLLREGNRLGLELPYAQLRVYEKERAEKLSLLPLQHLFKKQTSALFSLEAFSDEVDIDDASDLLLQDGSMATSPSATAFMLSQTSNYQTLYPASVEYLANLLSRNKGGLPTIAPCDIFIRAWMLNYLYYADVTEDNHSSLKDHYEFLLSHWTSEGVGWASTGLPESDDTAMVLAALKRAGYELDGSILLSYERANHFAVLEHERNPSVSVNMHILEAIETLPKKDQQRAKDKILAYLIRSRKEGAYWHDKWHASAYYPTSRAVMILAPFMKKELNTTVQWLLANQRADGSWGQYIATVEETALVLLALLNYHRAVEEIPTLPLHRAAQHLMSHSRPDMYDNYTELWISKALYAPNFVIRSAVVASLKLYYETFGESQI